MICKFCNAENPEDAVFCASCGKRIDGKIVCPKCNTANPETAVFCTKCGTRIDGKRTCPSCGAVLDKEVRFCPTCGHQSETRAKESRAVSRLELAGAICTLAAAAFAFIFVFCLGTTSTMTTTKTDMYLYDFFGKQYQAVDALLKSFGEYAEYIAYSYYLRYVLCTIVSAGALVAVPVCAAVAGVRFARYLRGKAEKTDYFTPAAAAYAVLLCSACALLALNYGEIASEDTTFHITLNGATIAGIVMGGASFLAGCVLLFLAKGAQKERKKIAQIVSAAVGTALSVVILAVTACGAIGITQTASGYVGSDRMAYTVLTGMMTLGSQYCSKAQRYILKAPIGAAVVAGIATCAQLAAIALAGAVFVRLWRNMFVEKRRSLLPVSIPFFACAILYLVMNIVFGNLFAQYLEYVSAVTSPVKISLSYATPIVTLVFATLLFALSVVMTVLFPKQKPSRE